VVCVKCGLPIGYANAGAAYAAPTNAPLSLWGYFTKCFKNYATFDGRARRSEYWGFYLFSWLFGLVPFIGWYLWPLAVLIPSLAVFWRRMHDTGRSGACILYGLIPFAGFIILLIFLVQDSAPGDNQYGPNPKGM